VDVSGAADAGKGIWIADGVVENGVLLIEGCFHGGGLSEGRTGRDPSVSQHVPDAVVCRFRPGLSRWAPHENSGVVKRSRPDPIILGVSPKPQQCRRDVIYTSLPVPWESPL
jgi:hypothetical protein